jgi:predicted dehydrogenase
MMANWHDAPPVSSVARSAHAAGRERFSVGLIGAGGRGTGAAAYCLDVSKSVRIVAIGDAFEDRARASRERLRGQLGEQVDVPDDRLFAGLDAYQGVIGSGVDLLIDASPPGFRPRHYRAAIEAGKHCFLEKPLCVDAGGYRSLVETNKLAENRKLSVAAGFFRRHHPEFAAIVRRIRDRQFGAPKFLRCYALLGATAGRRRKPGMLETAYQVYNWHHFNWVGGGRMVEGLVHQLDSMNWIMDGHPTEVNAMGGRQTITESRFGQDYDHHALEFTYPDGTKLFAQSRQMNGVWRTFADFVHCEKETLELSDSPGRRRRKRPAGGFKNAWHQQHVDQIEAILSGEPYHEGRYGATSSFTAVIGRMASYSGRVIRWNEAAEKGPDLFPARLAFDADPPVVPDENGSYQHAVPMPGVYKPF